MLGHTSAIRLICRDQKCCRDRQMSSQQQGLICITLENCVEGKRILKPFMHELSFSVEVLVHVNKTG